MPPKVRSKHTHLPKYVTVVNKVYVVYRPYIPEEKRRFHQVDKYGFLKPAIKLGKADQSNEAILRKYLAAQSQLDEIQEPRINTLLWLSEGYKSSRQFTELASTAQKHYKSAARILDQPISKAGQSFTLGDWLAREITKPLIQAIVGKRLVEMKSKGLKGEAIVNYEARYISSILAWDCNYIHNLGMSQNPLKGLKRVKEPRNKRYVTDHEYNIQKAKAPGYLPIYFELAYLCAGRMSEIRDLRESDVLEDGLRMQRAKGSRDNIVLWTPRLRNAVELARANRTIPKVVCLDQDIPLLTDRNGQKINNEGIKSAMSRLKRSWLKPVYKMYFGRFTCLNTRA